jgi:hypothetical protein
VFILVVVAAGAMDTNIDAEAEGNDKNHQPHQDDAPPPPPPRPFRGGKVLRCFLEPCALAAGTR